MSHIDWYSERALNRLREEAIIPKSEMFEGMRFYGEGEENTALAKARITFHHGSYADEIPGLHHAFEHMMFKGKNKELVRQMEFLGASVNAFTSMSSTAFIVECNVFKADKVFTLFAELFRPEGDKFTVDPKDWEMERTVIHSERVQSETDSYSITWDALMRGIYLDDVQSNILGTEENINSMKPEDFTKVFNETVYRQNVSIVVSASKKLIKHLSTVLCNKLADIIPLAEDPNVINNKYVFERKTKLNHAIVNNAVAHLDYKVYANSTMIDLDPTNPIHDMMMLFVSTYISGGITSPLFENIREKLGNVYDCSSYSYRGRLGYNLVVEVGVHDEFLNRYIEEVEVILDDIRLNGISAEAFERTKNAVGYIMAKQSERGAIDALLYYGAIRAKNVYYSSHMLWLLEELEYKDANAMIKEMFNERSMSNVTIELYPKVEEV